MKKTAVFTIASRNYFAHVNTLMQSLEATNPDYERYVVCVDELSADFAALPRNYELVSLESLRLPDFRKMAFRYTILEFNTAVKPWAIERLLRDHERVVYLDPDIRAYRRFAELDALLDGGANFVYTPHLTHTWKADGRQPDEEFIMRCGVFNLGFIAVARSEETLRMVRWWQEKLEYRCVVDFPAGVFVDQKFMDLVPGLFEGTAVLRHDGYNVAYWNLSHRTCSKRDGKYYFNGQELAFFHFSGVNVDDLRPISKYQTRHTLDTVGVARELFEEYAAIAHRNSSAVFSSFKYAYNVFADGTPVLDKYRHYYRTHADMIDRCGDDPFARPDLFADPALFRRPGEKPTPLEKPDGVNLVGYIRSEHGVGQACRHTAEALDAAALDWRAFDWEVNNASRQTDRTWDAKIVGDFSRRFTIFNVNADQMSVAKEQLPAEAWSGYNIGVWYWELPEFPDEWQDRFGLVDEIWAPTRFVADALSLKATCPVVYMPPPIALTPPPDASRKAFGLPEKPFLFLTMFDSLSIQARKNPMASIAAFKAAFRPDDDAVGLVVKINNSHLCKDDVAELERIRDGYRNIHFIKKILPRADVDRLVAVSDAVISLHRSEGLGLLCQEAMCLGKPVIATNWSGNVDFMNNDCACMVDYALKPVGTDIGPYKAWQVWADADVGQATAYMKRLVAEPDYRARLSANAVKMMARYAPEVCGARMKRRLDEINRRLLREYGRIEIPATDAKTFVSGFSIPEGMYRWSDGASAKLRLDLPVRYVGKTLQLTLSGWPFTVPGKLDAQKVAILVNGKPLCEHVFTSGGDSSFDIAPDFVSTAELNLTLKFPTAASPRAFGMGEDRRKLALALTKVVVSMKT